jgi:hypothetical protein
MIARKSGSPGLDERNRQIVEVLGVTGCQPGIPSQGNSRDHNAPKFGRAAFAPPGCHLITEVPLGMQ